MGHGPLVKQPIYNKSVGQYKLGPSTVKIQYVYQDVLKIFYEFKKSTLYIEVKWNAHGLVIKH
jgi:hypothetical protein